MGNGLAEVVKEGVGDEVERGDVVSAYGLPGYVIAGRGLYPGVKGVFIPFPDRQIQHLVQSRGW